jgi:hypothetical protein
MEAIMDLSNSLLELLAEHKLLVSVSFIVTVLTIASNSLFGIKHDPREPPIISHPIPYIGHVIGMFRHGAKYFDFIKYVFTYLLPISLILTSS